jgi:hypothetical protein
MNRSRLVALTLCIVVAAASNAWGWGSVTGPRGGVAYRGPFGGGAYRGPNGGGAYRGPAGRAYAYGPNGAAAYRGPYGGGVARGPNGNYAVRGPTTYNYNVYRYGYGVTTPGVAAGVAPGVAVGTAAAVGAAYAEPSTSYYPPPYYCAFGDPSCTPPPASAAASAGGDRAAVDAQTACRGDAQRLCPRAVAARDRAAAKSCLVQNINRVSAACHQAMVAAGAPAPAAPATASAAAAPTAASANPPARDPQTACRGDAQRLCPGAVAARDREAAKSCLVQNIDKLSAPCHQAIEQAMR